MLGPGSDLGSGRDWANTGSGPGGADTGQRRDGQTPTPLPPDWSLGTFAPGIASPFTFVVHTTPLKILVSTWFLEASVVFATFGNAFQVSFVSVSCVCQCLCLMVKRPVVW